MARCELADYIAKAAAEVEKSLGTDYASCGTGAKKLPEEAGRRATLRRKISGRGPGGSRSVEGSSLSTETALDRFVAPLGHRLELRSRRLQEPDTVEDKAMLLMDHALDAHDPSYRGGCSARSPTCC